MSDNDNTVSPDPVPVEEGKKSVWSRISFIWLIPVIALAVALGAAYRNYAEQGPLIEITFDNAAGVKSGETLLRYRDIEVGLVEDVRFSPDLEKVIAEIRVDNEVADYIDAESRFWVVRPEVSARGVTGLDTVLSGVYIQGAWDSEPSGFTSRFEGLTSAPLLGADQQGVQFTLRSTDGLPAANTPIYYKGVQVGQVAAAEINADGTGVVSQAVIFEPHTELVTTATRFWDVSGFSFSLGTSGARLNFDSFASLISGGVTFETMGSGGMPLEDGTEFQLFGDEDAARDDFLVEGDGQSVTMSMVFDQNLSGLSTGAPVELGGLRVGEVSTITGLVDAERFGDNDVHLLTTVRINPGRIGLGEGAEEEELFTYLETRIAEGMRARLTNASLLTGGLKVVLVEVDDAEEATLLRDADPYPQIPTAPADVTDISNSAQGVLQRVSDLPIEEVMQSAIGFLNNATALVGSQALQEAPEELRGILEAVRGVAESEDVQGLPGQVSGVVGNLGEISNSLNNIIAELERQGIAETLTAAVEDVGTAADGLPGIVEQVDTLVASANEVPLTELTGDARALLASIRAYVEDPATQAIPDELVAAMTEVQTILNDVSGLTGNETTQGLPDQVSGVISNLGEISNSLNNIVAELEREGIAAQLTQTIEDVRVAADGLPALVDQADSILNEAGEVPLETLANRTSELLASAEAILDQQSTRDLPEELNGTLEELRLTLSELRAGGVVENTNATLASARDAASAIEEATQLLPGIATQLRQVANQAGSTLGDYGRDSEFSRNTRGAIRQIESAAEAIERLARTIERNPNSLILGR
ncbi:MlaD family protein [Roseivivax sp. THAF30]|uniref:MlaD family protein n=1 Tax=Roseivivax sp. THAF30 TaxID=2587852 RepID=UPI001267B749|nr:MlaD family protein [Roseivivax sp. THAF30]QFT62129.1 Paraquat-inducible protein B [Roseivivax sp. THAF30]